MQQLRSSAGPMVDIYRRLRPLLLLLLCWHSVGWYWIPILFVCEWELISVTTTLNGKAIEMKRQWGSRQILLWKNHKLIFHAIFGDVHYVYVWRQEITMFVWFLVCRAKISALLVEIISGSWYFNETELFDCDRLCHISHMGLWQVGVILFGESRNWRGKKERESWKCTKWFV